MPKRGSIALTVALVALFALPAGAQAATESLVTNASPDSPFPQNKQNEPGLAINPRHHNVLAAGTNEEIDEPPCDGSDCSFAQGVGNSGVYFSFDGGTSWTQPTYQGFSGRDGTLGPGPIGTLPHYDEAGLVSDGDPAVYFGPRPRNGSFSWSNGSRLYYLNLTANFSTERTAQTFKGFEAIAVSHADHLRRAANDHAGAWSDPVIVSKARQSQTTFADKPDIGVDNAASSPHFGNAYVCYTLFKSQQLNGPAPIAVSRSTDGGRSFSRPHTLTASHNGGNAGQGNGGRQGCNVRTNSSGKVFVVWEDTVKHHSVMELATSKDGGIHFTRGRTVASVTDVGADDQTDEISFDGIAGARTSSFPSLSIANGAPFGNNAPDTVALGWSDGSLNDEHALVQLSSNDGRTWSDPKAVEASGDRPDFAFLSISPDGSDLYTVYDGFTDPFRDNTSDPRRFAGVVRHSEVAGTVVSDTTTVDRGDVGDARASSANALDNEFLGDYNTVNATNGGAVSVYNDARNSAVCPTMNVFRQEVVDTGTADQFGGDDRDAPQGGGGETAPEPPAPATDCPPTFGNTDIFSAAMADPTP